MKDRSLPQPNQPIEPGSFRDAPLFEPLPQESSPFPEPDTYNNPFLITAVNFFSATFHPPLDVVYYPGSSVDTGPAQAEALKQSRIIFVDSAKNAIPILRNHNLEAYYADAATFDPGPVDLLLLINFFEEKPLEHVKPEGFVIVQAWGGSSTQMQEQSGFNLVGVIHVDPDTQEPMLDSQNLDEYFQEVDTDDEFRARGGYDRAAALVKKYFGNEENVLSRYKQLHEKSRIYGFHNVGPSGEMLDRIPFKKTGGFFIYQKKAPIPQEE